MSVPSPKQRECRALAATAIASYSGFRALPGDESVIVDLLADLMHWADGEGYSFDELIATATMHHDAEVRGEEF